MDWAIFLMLFVNLLLLPNLEKAKVVTTLYSIVATGFVVSATTGFQREVTHHVLSLTASGLFFSAAYDLFHASRRGIEVVWLVVNYVMAVLTVGSVLRHM